MVGLAVAATAAPAAVASEPECADRDLDQALEQVVQAPGGPPGAIAVIRRLGKTTVQTAGVADLQSGGRWSQFDHMKLASVSKAYSGAVALSLVRRGKLALDQTIGERLPDLPAAWSGITLRQLLQHTSGLPNYTANRAFLDDFSADPMRHFTPIELIAYVAGEALQFTPGSSYAYSNTDNIVVGLMAEAATGRPYEELLRTHVFTPLGLVATSLLAGSSLPRPFAHGYDVGSSPPEDISEAISMSGVWASGGLQSTAAELGRFIRGYVSGRLFGRALRSEQRRWVDGGSEPTGPGTNSAGLALFRYRTPCGTVYGHTGNFPGYTQFAAASSSARRSATVSVNTQLSPDAGNPDAWSALDRAFASAVCAALAR